jgi:hypothetical protein
MLVKHNKKNNKRDGSRRIREEDEEKDLERFNKRQISSEENNNNINSSSIDIEKLKIEKKEKKKKKKLKNKKNLDEIDKDLLQLEQKNKEKIINGELYELLEEVENENKDFKKNVFFSNFHELNNNLGIFDDINEKKDKNDNYVGVKGYIHPYGLIDKYSEKAKEIKKIKKK